MNNDIYRRLAQRLDALPQGFPTTKSGTELELLAKIFDPEEAAVANVMRLTYEPSNAIAVRAGLEPKICSRLLKNMVRKGQIYVKKGDRQLLYSLMPFVVGIYEAQLPRMDAELAELFEQYFHETRGGEYVRTIPSVHRVIPINQAIPVAIEIFPYERAITIIENAKSWAVRDCICRVQQKLIGKGCDHPLEACIGVAPVEGAFKSGGPDRLVTKEEALQILRETEEAGLIHTTGNYQNGNSYICNCCTCCCGILRSVTEFNVPASSVSSDFCAVVDSYTCIGCGECATRCAFKALAVEVICEVDKSRCVGCGQCATVCPTQAIHLERRPEGEIAATPTNHSEWLAQRAKKRNIDLQDLL
jgi:ferredoxin